MCKFWSEWVFIILWKLMKMYTASFTMKCRRGWRVVAFLNKTKEFLLFFYQKRLNLHILNPDFRLTSQLVSFDDATNRCWYDEIYLKSLCLWDVSLLPMRSLVVLFKRLKALKGILISNVTVVRFIYFLLDLYWLFWIKKLFGRQWHLKI